MSLANCLLKNAKLLSGLDTTSIREAATDYVKSGMSQQEAERKATDDKLAELAFDRARVEREILAQYKEMNPTALILQNQTPAELQAKKESEEKNATKAEEKRIADLERDQPLQLQGQDVSAERREAEAKRAQQGLDLNEPPAQYQEQYENTVEQLKQQGYQADLFAAPGEVAAGGPDQAGLFGNVQPVGALRPFVALKRQGEIRAGVTQVNSAEDAAHIFAGLRKGAREYFDVLMLDANQKPISYLRLFAGTLTQTAIYPREVALAAHAMPGVKSIWIAHNHPSGLPTPSAADVTLTRAIGEMFGNDLGVTLAGHIIVAGSKAHAFARSSSDFGATFDIPAHARSNTIPIVERAYVRAPKLTANGQVNSPDSAREAIRAAFPSGSGMILLTAQSNIIQPIPLSRADLTKLRGTGQFEKLMRLYAAYNPARFIAVGEDKVATDALKNIARASGLVEVEALDIFQREGDALRSSAETGDLPSPSGAFYSRGGKAQPIQLSDAESAIKVITKKWTNAPEIIAAADNTSDKVKPSLRSQMKKEGVTDARGAWYAGKIYLFTGNISSLAELERTVVHEARHYGMEGLFGKDLNPILMEIYMKDKGVRTETNRLVNALRMPIEKATEFALEEMTSNSQENLDGWKPLDDMTEAERDEQLRKLYDNKQNEALRKAVDAIRKDSQLSTVSAVNETLANMPLDAAKKLPGWQKLVARMNKWLLDHGFVNLAATFKGPSADAITKDILFQIEDFVKTGKRGETTFTTTLFSRTDQTESPEFLKWFGDSKVVDSAGKPLRVYHGGSFNEDEGGVFNADGGAHFGTQDAANMRTVGKIIDDEVANAQVYEENGRFYLDEDMWFDQPANGFPTEADARTWAAGNFSDNFEPPDTEPIITEAYLSIQNPKRVKDQGMDWTKEIALAKAEGHDGIVYKNLYEDKGKDSYIAFKSTQIKSVNNSGQFDGSNPDIRFSRIASDAAEQTPPETKGAANAYTAKKLASMAIGGKLVGEMTKNPSKFNWINKTLNTQLHKGLKNKEFGRVVWATQQFMEDLSQFATQAADFVPDILPNLGNTTHAVKWLKELKNPAKVLSKKKDLKDAGRMIFEGTMAGGGNPMEGRLYSAVDLKAKGLTDRAIEFYQQSRKAIDKSLNDLVMSDVIRMIGTRIDLDPSRYEVFKVDSVGTRSVLVDAIDQARRDAVKVASEAKKAYEKAKQDREYAQDLNENFIKRQERYTKEGGIGRVENASKAEVERLTKLEAKAESLMKKEAKRLDTWTDIQNKVEAAFKQADDLQAAGYAPLMRFGKFFVTATQGEDTLHRAHYENRLDANAARLEMQRAFPGAKITTGVTSDLEWKRFQGVTPETIMLFAKTLGLNLDEHQAAQKYYQEAVSSRSALKRRIKREGIPGFSDDLSRVLAGFITSNSRRASSNYNMPLIQQAHEGIDENDGDIRDEATKLVDQINNPTEDAAALRGIMYAWFIGGSIASAAVNFTQPLTMTLPELSQWGTVKAALAMKHAMRVNLPDHLKDAKKLADEKGITNPQEVYYLYNEAIRGVSSNKKFQTAMWAWGAMFSFAENMNRRTTFLASYEMWETADAKTRENMTEVTGATNAFDFAKRIIQRTQGIYNKGNRPNWARGAFGATIFTFKQYSIAYVEFASRLPTKQKAMAAAILILMAGLQGLPGAEDLEDIIDTLGQMMGYRTNSKDFLRQKAIELLGETAGAFLMTGLFNQSGRLGLGNLIPGTAMFKRSETERGDDLGEAAGPIGSLVKNVMQSFDEAQAGDYEGAIQSILPKALGDAAKGKQIWETGAAKDFKNRDVVQDLDKTDAILQGIGFNPGAKTDSSRLASAKRQDANQVKDVQSDIVQLWAEGMALEDDAKMERASNMLKSWNEKNPEAFINRGDVIDSAIRRRIEMGKSREERQNKTLPKSLRGYYSDR